MVFLAGLQGLACVPPFLVSSPSSSLPLQLVTHTPLPLFTWPAAWPSGLMVLGSVIWQGVVLVFSLVTISLVAVLVLKSALAPILLGIYCPEGFVMVPVLGLMLFEGHLLYPSEGWCLAGLLWYCECCLIIG